MTHTTKHTPGPLKAVQIIIENSPCTWAVQRKSIREQWGKPSIATYIDNEADARLFAAAPAMYLELQNIVEGLTDEITRIIEGNKPDTARLDYLANKAGQAIAQAEGTK